MKSNRDKTDTTNEKGCVQPWKAMIVWLSGCQCYWILSKIHSRVKIHRESRCSSDLPGRKEGNNRGKSIEEKQIKARIIGASALCILHLVVAGQLTVQFVLLTDGELLYGLIRGRDNNDILIA